MMLLMRRRLIHGGAQLTNASLNTEMYPTIFIYLLIFVLLHILTCNRFTRDSCQIPDLSPKCPQICLEGFITVTIIIGPIIQP